LEIGMRQSMGWSHQQFPSMICEHKQKRAMRYSRGRTMTD
jgi:hypothetical protein